MQVALRLEPESYDERRIGERHASSSKAVVRRLKCPQEEVRLVDISSQGCGFFSRMPLPVGARVWLSLPGLETWAATVAWFDGDRGGLTFDRHLHPLVAQRYASSIGGTLR